MDGKRLASLRKEKGMTQKDLADYLSISVNSVSLYERDMIQANDDIKIRIAQLFNCSMDYLMGLSDKRNEAAAEAMMFFCYQDLPEDARTELETFLSKFQHKYSSVLQRGLITDRRNQA